jgi:hypothetical protein
MRKAARIALFLFLAMAIARLVLFLGYAVATIPNTALQAFHLESKMVHLAWRVQAGERLYPEWRSFPHVANFFAPLYFVKVGLIGRALGSSLEGLYLTGRLISIGAALATSLLLGLDAGRRYGRGAGWVAAVTSLGVGPLFGYGVMVRPDTLADFLGLAGFLLAVRGRSRASVAGAGVLLVAAALTKQTAGVYLLPAAISLALQGRRREAAALVAGVLGAILGLVGAVMLFVEPNFGPALLAEGRTPWSWKSWRWAGYRLVNIDPQWVVLAPVGLWLWNRGDRRDHPATVLTLVLVPVYLVTSAKMGSDLNYALPFRAVGSLAAAALWDAVWNPRKSNPFRPDEWLILAMASVSTLLMYMSVVHALAQSVNAYEGRMFLTTSHGKMFLRLNERIQRLMADPSRAVLTDASQYDIRQGSRTAFGDPWLFHMLVDIGEIDPSRMRQWVETEHYDWIITSKELMDPSYDGYDFGLPKPLVDAARRHYQPSGSFGGLFFYRPHRLAGVAGELMP